MPITMSSMRIAFDALKGLRAAGVATATAGTLAGR